jgi:hypothetical protein
VVFVALRLSASSTVRMISHRSTRHYIAVASREGYARFAERYGRAMAGMQDQGPGDAADARYQRRVVDDQLDELFDGLPAIALEGPKAVGKTATALRRASTGACSSRTTRD